MYYDHILFLPRLLPDPATSIATQLHVLSLKKKQKEKVKNEIKTNKPKITKKRERKKNRKNKRDKQYTKKYRVCFVLATPPKNGACPSV